MLSDKKRISYIAQAQLIGCLLVILGHSVPLNWNIPSTIKSIDVFIYTFHMPLFFFISGYLFEKNNSANRYDFISYITKRSKKLILPYVMLTLIGFIPKILTKDFFGDEVDISINYFIKCFLVPRNNVWGHFWFLPTLLIISVFAFLFSKFHSKAKIGFCILVVVLFILPIVPKLTNITDWFAINDVIKFSCYYAFGFLFANSYFEKLVENRNTNKYLLILLPISIGLFLIDFDNIVFNNAIREFIGILMIIFVLVISQLFDITGSEIGGFLTRKTYSIFILSWPFQCIVSIVFESKLGLSYYITVPISFLVGIFGPIVTIILVDWFENKIKKKIISPIIGG